MWNYCPNDGRRFKEQDRWCPQCYCSRGGEIKVNFHIKRYRH
jgi:hypothetical protein